MQNNIEITENNNFLGFNINYKKMLYVFALMLFFWSVFDFIGSYLIPIIITRNGFTLTQMGFIISLSSLFGAILDFIISKYLDNPHFKRTLFLMFIICFIYPFILFHSNNLLICILAMLLWGLYFDFKNFGTFDFVSRVLPKKEHSFGFGIIALFIYLAGILSPLIVGFLIKDKIDSKPFLIQTFFLFLSFLFFIILIILNKKYNKSFIKETKNVKRLSLLKEFYLWTKLGRVLFPVLFMFIIINIIESFFWTIGPLYSENIKGFKGIFMTIYMFPVLLTGWFVGSLTKKFKQKKVAFISTIISSLCIVPFLFVNDYKIILVLTFISAFIASFSLPALKGAYTDYLNENERHEKELEGLADFATNIGYIIGPILAGTMADNLGILNTFGVLGIITAIIVTILLFTTPKHIKLRGM